MAAPKIIKVTAAPGRIVPMHHSVITLPGGGQVLLHPGEEIEVETGTYVRRRLRSGDLVEIKEPVPVVKPAAEEPAEKPVEIKEPAAKPAKEPRR